jgi:transposase
MGTPVPIRKREFECKGAGECISRPMTEEEFKKYFGGKGMVKKLETPSKEKLIEVLAEVQGKTKSMRHAAKAFAVSATTVYNWIKEYGIEFDESGCVIRESEETTPILEDAAQENIPKLETKEFAMETMKKIAEALEETKEETKQKEKALHCKVGYAEYDISENLWLKVDFRQKLVSVNDCKEFTFEEAEALTELMLEVI